MNHPTEPRTLARVRAGARATLALGIGASLAANVLAANPTAIGRVIAAWPPVALLVTVELLSRVPVTSGWLSGLRVLAAGSIAGIAAWVSYWHMVAVALEYGEATVAAHLLPFSVDGLVVVASVCLVELARTTTPVDGEPAGAEPVDTDTDLSPPVTEPSAPPAQPVGPVERSDSSGPKPGPRGFGPKVQTIRAQHPDWSAAQIADAVGCNPDTVRKHLRHQPATPEPIRLVTSDAPPVTGFDDAPVPGESDTRGSTPDLPVRRLAVVSANGAAPSVEESTDD